VNRKRRRKKEHQQKWQKNGDEYPAPEAEEVRACSSVTKRIQKVCQIPSYPFLNQNYSFPDSDQKPIHSN
jgi:hypothetical protein